MTLNAKIEASIASFARDIQGLLTEAAIGSVTDAFRSTLGAAAARSLPTAAKPAAAKPAAAAPKATPAAAPKKRGRAKGAKRDPEEIARLTETLREYVAGHPGQRIEVIAAALKVSTGELALPVQKLLADKKITKKGERRGTTYFGGK